MSEQSPEPSRRITPALKSILAVTARYGGAVALSFVAVGLVMTLMGFDAFKAFTTILSTSFRTTNGFVQTLLKFVPLMLQGFAFTIPWAARKFNIGGEGQLIAGAIGTTAVGIVFANLPPYLLLPLALLAGVVAGALWGLIPGWLLYRFNINVILTTVLLNFVAYGLIDYIATIVWSDPIAGHPTTIPIGRGALLPMLMKNPPLHSGIIIALLVAVAVYIYTNRTTGGYELIASGANPRASKVFGINIRVLFVLSMVLAGALAGLSGAIEVTGVQGRLIEGLHSNFAVLGRIIGLIARGSNLAVPFVAFFIAVLEVGASAMQRTMMIPVELVFIVEAMVLLFVLLADVVRRR
ncbi:MAG: ABC transporter permease [Anaerolineaceae bacterium]|nr:ABC transporter permease [Anaerolineaceae bacterium]